MSDDERRVVNKSDITHKKSGFSKFIGTFIGGDITDVVGHLIDDILAPGAVDLLDDMAHSFVDGMIYRDDPKGYSRSSGSRRRGGRGHTSYDRVSSKASKHSTISRSEGRRRSMNFDDLLFYDRRDAQDVLNSLREELEENGYDCVTVGDFYDKYEEACKVTIKPRDFNERKYGWEDLDDATIVAVRTEEGRQWYIKFPRAEYLAD